jgi:single-stranded-DNA-specific exonuclease
LQQCPDNWGDLHREYRQAVSSDRSLVLAYEPDGLTDAIAIWQQLVGVAKYLSRTQKPVTKSQIQGKLNLSDRAFAAGLKTLAEAGLSTILQNDLYHFNFVEQQQDTNLNTSLNTGLNKDIESFLSIIQEEDFQQQYFHQIPLETINQQLISYKL